MKRPDHRKTSRTAGVSPGAPASSAAQTFLSGAKDLVKTLGPAILIALAVRSSVVQAFWVPSGSMLPTIQIGDHIFVNKLAYTVRMPLADVPLTEMQPPHRGDIVVFVRPGDPKTDLIKRVIAVGGDTVEIRNKKVFVNGEVIDDAHAHFEEPVAPGQRDNMRPQTVPPGKFFVMGDNRDKSYDSRFWGFANISDIKGRATFVYWSRDSQTCWDELRRKGLSQLLSKTCLPRWRRFGLHIQ
jgi:signal peptidase I